MTLKLLDIMFQVNMQMTKTMSKVAGNFCFQYDSIKIQRKLPAPKIQAIGIFGYGPVSSSSIFIFML